MQTAWLILNTDVPQDQSGFNPATHPWSSAPLYWHSLTRLARCPAIEGIVLRIPDASRVKHQTNIALGVPLILQTASDPLCCAIPRTCTNILLHDARYPFVPPFLIPTLLEKLTTSPIVIPVTSHKQWDFLCYKHDLTPLADKAVLPQSPFAFTKDALEGLCEHGFAPEILQNIPLSLLPFIPKKSASTVMGSPSNTIILNTDDLPHPPVAQHLTVGQGYDVHRYGGARPMVLGGIPIPGPITIDAHSDGDVLVHAIMDALLGALALGDIGDHFPPTDPTYEGISSMLLLDMVLNLCKQAHLTILHLDATIIAQKPTIAPYREQIRKNLANALNLPRDSINIKATTEEKLGFTGHLEGIKAQAVVLCQKNPDPSPPLCDGIGQLFAF